MINLLAVFSKCPDKRKPAVDIRRVLEDILVSTPDELELKRSLIGSVQRYASKAG